MSFLFRLWVSNCSSYHQCKVHFSITESLLYLCQKTVGHVLMGLFLGFLFCPIDLCIYFSANTTPPCVYTRLTAWANPFLVADMIADMPRTEIVLFLQLSHSLCTWGPCLWWPWHRCVSPSLSFFYKVYYARDYFLCILS